MGRKITGEFFMRASRLRAIRRCLVLSILLIIVSVRAASQPAAGPEPAKSERIDGQLVLGDVVPFGDGTARTWVRLDANDQPTALGITLTEAALQGLPPDVTPGVIWMVEYVLAFPSDVPLLPFDHAGVNWNPRGHPPGEIYGNPHFDFHFYTISPDQRHQITARADDLERCKKAPSAGMLPAGYVYAEGAEEPGMGSHWIDPLSHEFHGKPFTSTFIFGSHDGKVIFWEPMITKAHLEERRDSMIPISQPTSYAERGYYPTSYSIQFDAKRKEYTVSLDGLTLREASMAQ